MPTFNADAKRRIADAKRRTAENMPTLNANMTTIACAQRNKTDAFDAECLLCSTDAECNNNTDTRIHFLCSMAKKKNLICHVTGALRDQFSICQAESHHVTGALRDQFSICQAESHHVTQMQDASVLTPCASLLLPTSRSSSSSMMNAIKE